MLLVHRRATVNMQHNILLFSLVCGSYKYKWLRIYSYIGCIIWPLCQATARLLRWKKTHFQSHFEFSPDSTCPSIHLQPLRSKHCCTFKTSLNVRSLQHGRKLCAISPPKDGNNAESPELPPARRGILRHVAWLHEPGQSHGEAVRSAWGGPQRRHRGTPESSSRSRSRSAEPHPDPPAAAPQELCGDRIREQPVGQQLHRDFFRLLPLLQAERGVCTGVPLTQAEIWRRESHLPRPLELHLPHLQSYGGSGSHAPLLPAGATAGRGEEATRLPALVEQLTMDSERLMTL